MCLNCQCQKQTCKICWEEVHFEKLCKHLQEEYNIVAVHDLIDKVIVCPICYAVTRKPTEKEAAIAIKGSNNEIESIECEGCHLHLCKKCLQSIDSIKCHGPCIHSSKCHHYSNERNKVGDGECEICEIKGYPCKEINYIQFLGF